MTEEQFELEKKKVKALINKGSQGFTRKKVQDY